MTRGPYADPGLLLDAAQKAAGAGDYPDAERLLREAAVIQEATLGADHHDLATTLNNLAFVCEQTGNIDEAERGYRRAHRIAVASLSPGHPFIKTSLSNLMEFCEARGIPIWTRPQTPVEDEPLPDEIDVAASEDVATAEDDARVADDASVEPFDVEPLDVEPLHGEPPAIEVAPAIVHAPAAASRLPLRMMAAAALVIVAIAVITFARQELEAPGEPRPVAYASTTTVPSAPVAPAAAAPPASEVPAPVPPRAPEAPAVPPKPRPASVNADASVNALKAQLCKALVKSGSPDWQCTPAGDEGPPGRYVFYTRLLTNASTTVAHRWYFNGRIHQTIRLRVPASPGNGYRTFSSNTVSAERAGDWKVELRAADGTVLDEAQFTVR